MSGVSSNGAEWFTQLEPAGPFSEMMLRSDDPRLGDVVEFWEGGLAAIRPGRAVLVGFPQDEGVRRSHGRAGAGEAPDAIRRYLYRLTPWDVESQVDLADHPLLDLGNVRHLGHLEESQQVLGEIVGEILRAGAIPLVLGGGHETAYGHYLGYVAARRPVGILNLDAHLDVRPCRDGQGHSGSPFRQALEHPSWPLAGNRYTCLGAQPHAVSKQHFDEIVQGGGVVHWCDRIRKDLVGVFRKEYERLEGTGCQVYVTVDADAVRAADVPGVSAPNPLGLRGRDVIHCVRLAGTLPKVSSLDLVEVNPRHDRDGQSERWAALAIWHFLIGLVCRNRFSATTLR